MPSLAHSSRSAGNRVPGASSPSLMAVPSRSTVSSNAVCEWTGANTVSSELTAAARAPPAKLTAAARAPPTELTTARIPAPAPNR